MRAGRVLPVGVDDRLVPVKGVLRAEAGLAPEAAAVPVRGWAVAWCCTELGVGPSGGGAPIKSCKSERKKTPLSKR